MTDLVGTVQREHREEAYRRDYSSEADFRKSVAEYILFCNKQRPHQTLENKSSVRFEELMDRKRHRLYEKPVSKMRTRINFFLTVFCFSNWDLKWTFFENPFIAMDAA